MDIDQGSNGKASVPNVSICVGDMTDIKLPGPTWLIALNTPAEKPGLVGLSSRLRPLGGLDSLCGAHLGQMQCRSCRSSIDRGVFCSLMEIHPLTCLPLQIQTKVASLFDWDDEEINLSTPIGSATRIAREVALKWLR
jgi:hypothetical protein